MTSLTDVFVTVKPDMDRFGPDVKRKLNSIDTRKSGAQVATRFGVGMNGAMGSIVSRSAGIFAAGFAAIQGAKVFGGFIQDARESAKISRITANAIKATGGAAHISADQVGALATSISNKTAIDDEQIQTAANMLLTFKNIRNETGKGNDVFNQATQAAADLSVQFGGIDGASKQLGKALNDPIKGTTALAKAGVTFTDQQKEQIKTLVKSGDVLGAQKIILKEIEGQVGGAAAAAADPLERLKVVAGNLGEEIGGFLLPVVNKFAGFATGTLIPGVQALFAAFQEGDVTSDGFVGFMERIGVAARSAFGFFKAEVLPRLKDFAGFVTGAVVPAVTNLVLSFKPLAEDVGQAVVAMFEKLWPVLQDVGGFIAGTMVPAVRDFTGWLKQNSSLVGALAIGIGAIVAAYKLWQGALFLVAAATKAYVAVQAALNVVMSLNPIGVVVLALVGLAAGLVYAYKKSETFRKVVDAAFRAVAAAGQFMWNNILKPMFDLFVAMLKYVWGQAQSWSRIVVAAFNAIKGPAVAVFRFVVGQMLDFVGNMINAAAKAFGWVPGIGPKLRNAATEFQKFRTSVNTSLNGIKDQTIKITPIVLAAQANRRASVARRPGLLDPGHATGGPIFGAGSGTSDSIPAWLSNGEHVWTAKEVQKAGGHSAVASMRNAVMKYAKGGRVGLDVKGDFPYFGKSVTSIAATAVAVARPIAQALGNAFAKINPGLEGVLKFVRSQVGKPYLWGGVGPRGYDCSGLVSAAINVALGRTPYRRLGATGSMPWSMFAPGPGAFEVGWFKGNPGHTAATVNGVNIESSGGRGVHMGPGARGARSSLFTNRSHVKGFALGGEVGIYDRGGMWPSGTLGYNGSGKTETVIPGGGAVELGPKSIAALDKLARAFSEGKFRIVQSGGGAYLIQTSNG